MKYIKQYKIFESNKTVTTQNVKDCFADITDNGFHIKVVFPEGGLTYGCVGIMRNPTFDADDRIHTKPFVLDDIKETLLFAIPYIREEYGLTTKDFRVATTYARYTYVYFDDFCEQSEKHIDIYEIIWEFNVPNNLNVIHTGNLFGREAYI
jgi:hypothetical protein